MHLSVVSSTVVILTTVTLGYLSIVYFLGPKYDPQEPPVLSHYIPYVGHILGLIRHGQHYFELLRSVPPHRFHQTLCEVNSIILAITNNITLLYKERTLLSHQALRFREQKPFSMDFIWAIR